jgi:methanogenic corrinoid protein MtbC1
LTGVEHGRDEFRKRLLAESLSDRFGVALLAGDAQAAEHVAQEALELALGADVPTDALPTIVADFEPAVFALSATMPENGQRVRAAVDVLTAARG